MVLDVVVFFFLLGVFARLVGSDLKLPEALYETLALYLLLAIGLKGGIELSKQPLAALAPQVLACMALGFAIPFVLYPLLRAGRLGVADAASLAAHYGSVSVVTFAVATAALAREGIAHESHAALWVAVMEAPGIVAGIVLARRAAGGGKTRWRELAHDVLFGKSVLLLAGGLAIGALAGEAGTKPIHAVFVVMYPDVMVSCGKGAGGRRGAYRRPQAGDRSAFAEHEGVRLARQIHPLSLAILVARLRVGRSGSTPDRGIHADVKRLSDQSAATELVLTSIDLRIPTGAVFKGVMSEGA